jgi:DNA excision repair protein ERCC-4
MAFSDNPEAFLNGFSPLSTILKNLQLRVPSFWPRFHLSVADSLDHRKAEVIELSVSMTDSMHSIQTAILQCMEVTLSEIKKGNSRELDTEQWDVETALQKSFDVAVKRQLDPVWHRVSWRTKQMVNDLTVLRKML